MNSQCGRTLVIEASAVVRVHGQHAKIVMTKMLKNIDYIETLVAGCC